MHRTLAILTLITGHALAADATHVFHTLKLGDQSFPTSVTKLGEKNLTTHTTAGGTIQAAVTARQTQPATQDKSQATTISTSTATTYTFTLPADQRDHTLKLGATPVTLRFTPTTASGQPVAK